MRDAGRINAQDKGLDSFGPRETSSGNNPTCCLRLGLIMITGESPGTGSRCLALEIVFCCLSSFGEPCPSLYMLKGRLTCRVLVGLELNYSLLQVRYKYESCFLVKEIFLMPSVLSRPIITRPSLLGLGPLSSVWPAIGAIIKSPGS